jgi:hypothetical protein
MAEELSVDAAVSLLATPEPEAPEQTQQDEPETSTTEVDDASEATEPGDGVEAEPEAEAEAEALDPPPLWDAEDKALFATLTPEVQATILKQEAKRESVNGKAKEEAAAARKLHQQRAQELEEVVKTASEALPKAQQAFQSRWENVDWVAYAEMVQRGEASASDYNAHKAQYDADVKALTDAQAHAQRAAREQAKIADERFETEIATLAPALCEPTKGPANRQALSEYIVKNGVPREVVPSLAAAPVALFWKAMQFDQAQAALKSRPKQTPPIPLKGNVAPTPAPSRTSQQRSVMTAPTNTVTGATPNVGAREDLEDVIYRVAPEDTLFTSNIGK